MDLPESVRRHAASVVSDARHVRIDLAALDALDVHDAAQPPAPDDRHFASADRDALARYVLALNAVNFGSGWFPTLRKRSGSSGYWTVAWALGDHAREHGPWSPAQLRSLTGTEVAGVLGQPVGHPLMALYAGALRALGRWLGPRSALAAIEASGGSAVRLATDAAAGMPFYRDRGLYKRAQILGADVAAFGLLEISDLDRLTMFADNLVPHVLRCHGVLHYTPELAATIDAERLLPLRRAEHEIRSSAVHAIERLAARSGIAPHRLDAWLWHEGQRPEFKARPRHRCRTVFY